jgi:hypothetical protein
MSYLEAAGWLRHAYIGIHPWDLALRDHGVTTSYGVAAYGDRLETALPSTVAQESGLDVAPFVVVRLDIEVNQALRLARLWRQLGERRTWRPLADADAVRKTLQSLGCGVFEEGVVEDWLAGVQMTERGAPADPGRPCRPRLDEPARRQGTRPRRAFPRGVPMAR